MDNQNRSPLEENDDNSLEKPDTLVEQSSIPDGQPAGSVEPEPASPNGSPPASPNSQGPKGFSKLIHKFKDINIYLLGFIFLFLVSGTVVAFVVLKGKNGPVSNQNSPQSLSESQLEQLSGSAQTIGNSSQVLNIGANTIFKGQVLVQKDLDVAGNIKIGGSLSLPGISVAGGAKFAQIQTNKLSVSGVTTLSGELIASGGLNITGSSNFSGPVSIGNLTVQNLTLGSVLTLDSHVKTGGNAPTRTTGGAVGNGGTTSVSGSDTSGTVSINTGSSPSAGCFVTVYFANSFSATPHVVITPVGSYAGSLEYYVNRSTASFSICTDSAAGSGRSFGFDYIVFD